MYQKAIHAPCMHDLLSPLLSLSLSHTRTLTDRLNFNSMADALPKSKKKQDVKAGDWATKTAVFNEL